MSSGPDDNSKSKVENNETSSSPIIEEVAEMDNENTRKKVSSDFDDYKEGKEELKEEIEMNNKEKNDWSDWEDVEGNISDEIEEELKKMSSERQSTEGKVQTSPSPYRGSEPPSPPPVSGDWSDMPEADRSNLTFSEKSASPSHSTDYTVANLSNDSMSTSAGPDTIFRQSVELNYNSIRGKASLPSPAQTTKSLKLKSPSSSAKPKGADKKSTVGKLDDLGLGYDIKSIEIQKSIPVESDFFADMMPNISLSSHKPDVHGQVDSGSIRGIQEKYSESMGSPTGKEKLVQSSMFSVDSLAVNVSKRVVDSPFPLLTCF